MTTENSPIEGQGTSVHDSDYPPEDWEAEAKSYVEALGANNRSSLALTYIESSRDKRKKEFPYTLGMLLSLPTIVGPLVFAVLRARSAYWETLLMKECSLALESLGVSRGSIESLGKLQYGKLGDRTDAKGRPFLKEHLTENSVTNLAEILGSSGVTSTSKRSHEYYSDIEDEIQDRLTQHRSEVEQEEKEKEDARVRELLAKREAEERKTQEKEAKEQAKREAEEAKTREAEEEKRLAQEEKGRLAAEKVERERASREAKERERAREEERKRRAEEVKLRKEVNLEREREQRNIRERRSKIDQRAQKRAEKARKEAKKQAEKEAAEAKQRAREEVERVKNEAGDAKRGASRPGTRDGGSARSEGSLNSTMAFGGRRGGSAAGITCPPPTDPDFMRVSVRKRVRRGVRGMRVGAENALNSRVGMSLGENGVECKMEGRVETGSALAPGSLLDTFLRSVEKSGNEWQKCSSSRCASGESTRDASSADMGDGFLDLEAFR